MGTAAQYLLKLYRVCTHLRRSVQWGCAAALGIRTCGDAVNLSSPHTHTPLKYLENQPKCRTEPRQSPHTHTPLKYLENQPKCRTEPRQLAINGSAESGAASSGHSLPLAIAT